MQAGFFAVASPESGAGGLMMGQAGEDHSWWGLERWPSGQRDQLEGQGRGSCSIRQRDKNGSSSWARPRFSLLSRPCRPHRLRHPHRLRPLPSSFPAMGKQARVLANTAAVAVSRLGTPKDGGKKATNGHRP